MKIRFAVIDDAAFVKEVLKDIMTSIHCTCVGEASDGEEALTMVKANRPDLIFLDLVLPKINGIEVGKKIKAMNPKCKIIGCSSLDNPAIIKEALDAGFNIYVKKPFTRDEVLSAVLKTLARQEDVING